VRRDICGIDGGNHNRYICNPRGEFLVDTVGALAGRLREEDWVAGRAPEPAAVVPAGRAELLIGRYIEQAMRRLSNYRPRFA